MVKGTFKSETGIIAELWLWKNVWNIRFNPDDEPYELIDGADGWLWGMSGPSVRFLSENHIQVSWSNALTEHSAVYHRL